MTIPGQDDPFSSRFGRRRVDAAARRSAIRATFRAVAGRYDLMNDLMSLGIHRLWKRRLVAAIGAAPGRPVLDLAGGTGDVAFALARQGAFVTVADPSFEMMQVGRRRCDAGAVGWVLAEAERLPFATASFDAVAISFGIRNVTQLRTALAEIHRVLRPGGRFLCLEFSEPAAWLAPFYRLWSRTAIPVLGATVSGRTEAYRYLIESIEGFPDQTSFAAEIAAAGFEAVTWRDLSFGIAAIHSAVKPAPAV
jgi:demethylmenaquinone methyltransferase/2-methoxy-6-polyprenyl-1,4-benzoquinol methylase